MIELIEGEYYWIRHTKYDGEIIVGKYDSWYLVFHLCGNELIYPAEDFEVLGHIEKLDG